MFYSVPIGRRAGIYLRWQDCEAATSAYSGAVFQKWQTLREATQHMNKCGYTHDDILVHMDEGSLTLHEYCNKRVLLVPCEVPYTPTTLFDLGHDLHIEACCFRGEPRIDIRMWESDKRTKKGISLTPTQWDSFHDLTERLEADLKMMKAGLDVHKFYSLGLGDAIFVSMDSPYRVIHIRRWYQQDGEWKPGRKGITLREREWRQLLDLKEHLTRSLKHLQ